MSEDNSKIHEPGSHLSDIEDGAGCTEIWETLSELRSE